MSARVGSQLGAELPPHQQRRAIVPPHRPHALPIPGASVPSRRTARRPRVRCQTSSRSAPASWACSATRRAPRSARPRPPTPTRASRARSPAGGPRCTARCCWWACGRARSSSGARAWRARRARPRAARACCGACGACSAAAARRLRRRARRPGALPARRVRGPAGAPAGPPKPAAAPRHQSPAAACCPSRLPPRPSLAASRPRQPPGLNPRPFPCGLAAPRGLGLCALARGPPPRRPRQGRRRRRGRRRGRGRGRPAGAPLCGRAAGGMARDDCGQVGR
jgi:hypothetical protein